MRKNKSPDKKKPNRRNNTIVEHFTFGSKPKHWIILVMGIVFVIVMIIGVIMVFKPGTSAFIGARNKEFGKPSLGKKKAGNLTGTKVKGKTKFSWSF